VVPAPYGRWDLEVMDSHSGWTSTAGDLLRFLNQLHNPEQPLLRTETRQVMLARPDTKGQPQSANWYGCGWNVQSDAVGRPATVWHDGGLDGTSALIVQRSDGYSWAILFNVDFTASEVRCYDAVDRLIHQVIDAVELD
jgi:CubicO group peptidase (beta-lactamase class C family)